MTLYECNNCKEITEISGDKQGIACKHCNMSSWSIKRSLSALRSATAKRQKISNNSSRNHHYLQMKNRIGFRSPNSNDFHVLCLPLQKFQQGHKRNYQHLHEEEKVSPIENLRRMLQRVLIGWCDNWTVENRAHHTALPQIIFMGEIYLPRNSPNDVDIGEIRIPFFEDSNSYKVYVGRWYKRSQKQSSEQGTVEGQVIVYSEYLKRGYNTSNEIAKAYTLNNELVHDESIVVNVSQSLRSPNVAITFVHLRNSEMRSTIRHAISVLTKNFSQYIKYTRTQNGGYQRFYMIGDFNRHHTYSFMKQLNQELKVHNLAACSIDIGDHNVGAICIYDKDSPHPSQKNISSMAHSTRQFFCPLCGRETSDHPGFIINTI